VISVPHRSRTGDEDVGWDFDAAAGLVRFAFRRGVVVVDGELPVCTTERPRPGAHPIVRIDGESWRILPVRYVRCGTEMMSSDSALAPGLSFGALVVTDAPPHVCEALERFLG
jgi:hypothetical protein